MQEAQQTQINRSHKECDELSGCQEIRNYANMLKDLHKKNKEKEKRYHGITVFAYLTV
jgi:RNA polymerase-interacting CarD/CdnL/TRCF family regulator